MDKYCPVAETMRRAVLKSAKVRLNNANYLNLSLHASDLSYPNLADCTHEMEHHVLFLITVSV
jgi:hypothetical protein